MLLQIPSLTAGAPGAQESTIDPATHDVLPVEPHAPTPHDVGDDPNSSSVEPSQSSSNPLQSESLAAGVPGEHVSTTEPDTQDALPVELHAPTPHEVGVPA